MTTTATDRKTTELLRVHPENGRYFANRTGNTVYLTGSHTWANLQELKANEEEPDFDYVAHLDWLKGYGHNFTRLWAWEQTAWTPNSEPKVLFQPHPHPRTGPGNALDGLPKFDLSQDNDAYYERMRERVLLARDRGLYVMVMLFQGFSTNPKNKKGPPVPGAPWIGHPFNKQNNINGLDGDPNGDGHGRLVHTLEIPDVLAVQERYVRKVIDTVNDLDNVLYEIANESHGSSTEWQYHMIKHIRRHEARKAMQHPVVMTFQWDGIDCGKNANLFASPADAISLGGEGGTEWKDRLMNDPPATDGSKVHLLDTDHFFGVGGDRKWVWKSFCRGYNPIFMDPNGPQPGNGAELPNPNNADEGLETARTAMGHTLQLAQRVKLAAMTPQNELCSTGYCLANSNADTPEYVVYAPDGGPFTVDLTAVSGTMQAEWFDVAKGKTAGTEELTGGAKQEVQAPFDGDAVLYVKHSN